MKLTILLLLISFAACGQSGTLTDLRYEPSNGEKVGTNIKLMISPSMPDSMAVSDKDLFIAVTGWNLLRYEIEVYRMRKFPCDYKCVDLRIINRGKTNDYTFEEFRKILWP